MPRLIVKQSGATRTVDLAEDAVTLGRTPDNTIPLPVEGVSRKHAQILFIGKGWEVVDLGSRNGTKVNGEKVKRAVLKPGDVVDIGGIEIVYEDGAGAPAGGGDGGDGGLEAEELALGGDAPAASAVNPRAADAAPAGECVLRFLGGEKDGTTLPLKTARTTFGRRPSNTVSFEDSSVSGVHCEITREPNGFVLRDLGSTNGTLVDGEPVVEAILRHNSRIRVGAQRIVFVDTSVADIESSLSGGDEASEWGLMRGELDVEGGGRRSSAGALVGALVVVALAGAVGLFVWQAKPKRTVVPTIKDNRIVDFSFEEGVVRWFSPGERETALARIDGSLAKPRGASGVQCLEVLPVDGGTAEGEPALVVFRAGAEEAADATVTPGVAYEIGARVGGGTGAVAVQWTLSSRPGLVREACSPPVAGDGSWPETKTVVTAPAGASGARILLSAFDGAPAAFDDVIFRRAEGAAAPYLDSGDLEVRIDGAACLEAVRSGEILLTQGGLAPSVETTPAALLGTVLTSPPVKAGSMVAVKATLRSGAAFETQAEEVAGGARIGVIPAGAPGTTGAFTFTLPGGLQRGVVTLVQERTAVVVSEAADFKAAGVVKIIVGTSDGPLPFVLSAAPGSPGWDFTSRRTPRGLRVQLAPPAGAGPEAASAWLSVNLSAENEAAVGLLRTARNHKTAGRLGDAVAAFEKVALAYHYLPDYRKQAEDEGTALLAGGKGRLKAARDLAGGARRFRSAPDLESVVRECGLLATDYAGHAIAEEAKTLGEGAASDLAKVREERITDVVERLYRRAADYDRNEQKALALLLMREIERVAPEGNEFRDAAEEKIPVLEAEVAKQQTALYGARK